MQKLDLLNWFALELPVWWQDIGNVVKSRSSSYCFVSKFLSHYSAVCWFSRYFFKVSGLSGGGGHTRTAFYLSLCHVRATGISFFSTGCCLKWCIFCCLTILGSEYFDVSLCCVWIGRQHRRLSSFLCCPPMSWVVNHFSLLCWSRKRKWGNTKNGGHWPKIEKKNDEIAKKRSQHHVRPEDSQVGSVQILIAINFSMFLSKKHRHVQ